MLFYRIITGFSRAEKKRHINGPYSDPQSINALDPVIVMYILNLSLLKHLS